MHVPRALPGRLHSATRIHGRVCAQVHGPFFICGIIILMNNIPFGKKDLVNVLLLILVVAIVSSGYYFFKQSGAGNLSNSGKVDSYSVSGKFEKMLIDKNDKFKLNIFFTTDFNSESKTGIIDGNTIYYAIDSKTGAKVSTNGTADIKKGDSIGVTSIENILEAENPFMVKELVLYK